MAEDAHARPVGAGRAGFDDNRGQRLNEASLPHLDNQTQGAPQLSPADAYRHWKALDQGPTDQERSILRRAARAGGVLVTQGRRGCIYSFATDGQSLRAVSFIDIDKFITLGWLVADPNAPSLFPGLAPAQRYLVAPEYRQ